MTTLHETVVPERRRRRITVLISGGGTNLQALLDAPLPHASITHVFSSRSTAYGLQRARTHTPSPIPTTTCALKTFLNRHPGATREDYDAEVARLVLDSRPDLVVLAGWMHILSDRFLSILEGRSPPPPAPALPPPEPASLPTQTEPIPSHAQPSPGESQGQQTFPIPIINLHPALPGAFDGANAIQRAHEAFAKGQVQKTGVMVHRVVAEVDRGEPLIVREVDMKEGESLEELEGRIHQVEHEIIVEGARKVLEELDQAGRP